MAHNTGSSSNKDTHNNIFIGDSQMAALMGNYDWNAHALGDPDSWPLSLKTGLRILLHSAHPMFIWWSEEMYIFYNDAYIPLNGNKHPHALGAKGYDVWAEIWPQLGKVVEGILQGEKAFYGVELLVPLNRRNFIEDAYFTFSYSAMFNDEGKVGGIFCACHEVTETVLTKRRFKTIKDFADALNGLPTVGQACETACEVLAGNTKDVPFCLIYLLNQSGTEATLAGQTAPLPQTTAPFPKTLYRNGEPAKWPFTKAQGSGQAEVVDLAKLEFLNIGADANFPPRAVILPISQSVLLRQGRARQENNQILGFFISGINPGIEYDINYQDYHQLITGQLASSIADIKSTAEISNQKSRLESFFMQAPAAICVLDGPELAYELVNPGYQELFPGRELMGKPILEVLPEIADNAVYRTFREVYETGHTHEEQELLIPLSRPEDSLLEDRYFKYIQQARHDENGNIDGVLVFAYEVTDLVLSRQKVEESERMLQATSIELAAANKELAAANDELSNSNQQLLRINADLDNFIYSASHDLKAPITNIEGLLQLLMNSLSPETKAAERTHKITGMMQTSIDRFKKTIANLTEITKLQKENNQQSVLNDINEVLKDVILDLDPMIKSTKARLELDNMDCISIHFSQKNLRSIIYNLLSNAIKYHSPQRAPIVQVSCRKDDGYLALCVQDNGLGMDLSDGSKIFGMFTRLHNHVEGDGIGLYMVKKIIDNAGGRIEVESRAGEGSTFQVYFKE